MRAGNPGWQEDFRSDLLEQSFHPGFASGALETAWDESTTRCPKDSNTAPEDQIPDFGGRPALILMREEQPMRSEGHELLHLILEDGCLIRCIEGEQQAVGFKAVEEIGHPIGDIRIGGVPAGQV